MGEKRHIPSLREIREAKRADLAAIMDKDPAATSEWSVRHTYAGYKALSAYRLANRLYLKGFVTLAKLISNDARRRTGVEIHPAATLGKGIMIDHGSGVAYSIRASRSAARARIRASATPLSKTTLW